MNEEQKPAPQWAKEIHEEIVAFTEKVKKFNPKVISFYWEQFSNNHALSEVTIRFTTEK